MNANKLADKLQDCYEKDVVIDSAATMLRQLQAENEALKRPNNVVGVPQDKLTDMQVTIRQLQAENEELKQCMVTAIKAGDWKVDGACDPDIWIGDRLK